MILCAVRAIFTSSATRSRRAASRSAFSVSGGFIGIHRQLPRADRRVQLFLGLRYRLGLMGEPELPGQVYDEFCLNRLRFQDREEIREVYFNVVTKSLDLLMNPF